MRRARQALPVHGALILVGAIIGVPVVWVIAAGFRTQISLLTGEFLFTPVLSNFVEVLFYKTSDFIVNYLNSMIVGSATVLIGGRPAARLGDSTAHGGTVVVGCPTVMIGG